MATIRYVKMTDNAWTPTKGSPMSAGYDIYAAYDVEIPAWGKGTVPTDLKISVPHGTYGRLAPRSGLAITNHIDVAGGVIDGDYRGPLVVVLFNHGKVAYQVFHGTRIAQLICEKIEYPEIEEVAPEDLDPTARGDGGFGSTGMGRMFVKDDQDAGGSVMKRKCL